MPLVSLFPEHVRGIWLLASSLVLTWPWLVWAPSVACGLLGSAWCAEGAKEEGTEECGQRCRGSQYADPELALPLSTSSALQLR